MSNPYALAASLARPVARGWLTRTEADVSLLNAAMQAQRNGSPYDPVVVYGGLRHILSLHLEAEDRRRDRVAGRIRRRLKPLLALRKPRNVLLAEAHDVNGDAGFPLLEPEVAEIAAIEAYWDARRARHG